MKKLPCWHFMMMTKIVIKNNSYLDKIIENEKSRTERNKGKPRGDFNDLLSAYAGRLADILQDEVDDTEFNMQSKTNNDE